jgi:phenylacetate-coenzyme A ligase PaaK-like adenylate-forming protein
MRTGIKIVLLVLLAGCADNKPVVNEQVDNTVDSILHESNNTTNDFQLIIYKANRFENKMWNSVENKIDSLNEENAVLKKKLGKSVRIIGKDGQVKNLGTLEDIKKRLRKNEKDS